MADASTSPWWILLIAAPFLLVIGFALVLWLASGSAVAWTLFALPGAWLTWRLLPKRRM